MKPRSRYLEGVPVESRRRKHTLYLAVALIGVCLGALTFLRTTVPDVPERPDVVEVTEPRRASPAFAIGVAALVILAVTVVVSRVRRGQLAVVEPIQRARLHLAQGELDQADEVLRAALREKRDARPRALLLNALAMVALERGDFDDALAIISEAEEGLKRGEVHVAPSHDTLRADLRVNAAEALLGLGRLDEAARRLDPLPAEWLPMHRAASLALSVCLAGRRGDREGALKLLRENATAVERTLPMRARWLLRAVEVYASTGSLAANALPDDPALTRWIARRFPHAPDGASATDGGAA